MNRPNRLARIAQHAKKIDVTDVKKYKDGSYGGTTEYSHYEPKGPFVIEAKVDKEKSPIYSLPRTQARNERRFGKKGSTEPQGFFGQKPSEAAELSKKRTDEHKAKRGVKNESVSGIEVQNVSDGIKFREYEFIDVIKNEPMKSPKNNITWTEGVKRDEYGDPVKKDGSYAGKKNEDKNPKDEKITRSEANMPVKGLVKLAAMVADNNKKRKNALQIQKYIGEDKKMGRQSDEALAAAHKKFSSMDQTSPANSFMTKRIQKEIDRRKKTKPDVTNEETIAEKSNTGPKSPKADTRIKNRTAFTQDRVLNSTPDEERGAAKRMSTAEMIRQKKRDEVQKKKEAFQKKRKGLMAKGQIKSKQ